MSKTKDFGSRIGKEMKHSFVEGRVENDHETTKRFNERFKYDTYPLSSPLLRGLIHLF